jgi:hypothetical protein
MKFSCQFEKNAKISSQHLRGFKFKGPGEFHYCFSAMGPPKITFNGPVLIYNFV